MQVENSFIRRQNRGMTIWKLWQGIAVAFLIGAGCGSADRPDAKGTATPPPKAAASTNTASTPQSFPTEAQPKLKTLKLWIGAEELVTEIASTAKEITTGMMHRKSMEENEGMLFIFPYPHQTSFWMKNTLIPLSCAYIDPDGVILETHDMKPLDETGITAATTRVQFVLEVKQGWFDRHNIKPGVVVRTERGTLRQTFLRQP
jgi:uncharacterized membrane protein (UPF0127 family)